MIGKQTYIDRVVHSSIASSHYMLLWRVELPVNEQEGGEGIEAGKGGLNITKLSQDNTRLSCTGNCYNDQYNPTRLLATEAFLKY